MRWSEVLLKDTVLIGYDWLLLVVKNAVQKRERCTVKKSCCTGLKCCCTVLVEGGEILLWEHRVQSVKRMEWYNET